LEEGKGEMGALAGGCAGGTTGGKRTSETERHNANTGRTVGV